MAKQSGPKDKALDADVLALAHRLARLTPEQRAALAALLLPGGEDNEP